MTWKMLLLGVLCAGGAAAQKAPMAKDAHPSVEVATIRPSDPTTRHQGFNTEGQKIMLDNESITALVMFAYGVHPKQIVGGPALMDHKFDVRGVFDTPGEPNLKQLQEMVAKLLGERFGLKFHHEQRTLPVYAITALKSGAKLPPRNNDPDGSTDQDGRGGPHGQEMLFTNNTMDDLAFTMQYFLDRPVVNQTGIDGRYTFTLKWKPGVAAVADPADYPDFFTAAQQELGLKVSRATETVDVLVVDAVTDPTEN